MKSTAMIFSFTFLFFIAYAASAYDKKQSSSKKTVQLSMDGLSFNGRIKSSGLLGLFSVPGTIKFRNGLMFWSAQGEETSAPYNTIQVDSGLEFYARLPSDGHTYVDWKGTYNGKRLIDVKAVWDRTSEKDFVHELVLSDKVILIFTPEN